MHTTPEGALGTPTGPTCYHLVVAETVLYFHVCVTESAWRATSIGSYYDGPIERRL